MIITAKYTHRLTKLDAVFQGTDEVWVRKLYHLEGIVLLHVPYPFVGLTLRINEQWPAGCVTEQERKGY